MCVCVSVSVSVSVSVFVCVCLVWRGCWVGVGGAVVCMGVSYFFFKNEKTIQ